MSARGALGEGCSLCHLVRMLFQAGIVVARHARAVYCVPGQRSLETHRALAPCAAHGEGRKWAQGGQGLRTMGLLFTRRINYRKTLLITAIPGDLVGRQETSRLHSHASAPPPLGCVTRKLQSATNFRAVWRVREPARRDHIGTGCSAKICCIVLLNSTEFSKYLFEAHVTATWTQLTARARTCGAHYSTQREPAATLPADIQAHLHYEINRRAALTDAGTASFDTRSCACRGSIQSLLPYTKDTGTAGMRYSSNANDAEAEAYDANGTLQGQQALAQRTAGPSARLQQQVESVLPAALSSGDLVQVRRNHLHSLRRLCREALRHGAAHHSRATGPHEPHNAWRRRDVSARHMEGSSSGIIGTTLGSVAATPQ